MTSSRMRRRVEPVWMSAIRAVAIAAAPIAIAILLITA